MRVRVKQCAEGKCRELPLWREAIVMCRTVRNTRFRPEPSLRGTDYSVLRTSPLAACSGPPFWHSPPLHGVVTASGNMTSRDHLYSGKFIFFKNAL